MHARSGLNLTRTRAYSASLGRFISRDPIQEYGGVNLYAYCQNDPVTNTDPSGLVCGSKTKPHRGPDVLTGTPPEIDDNKPPVDDGGPKITPTITFPPQIAGIPKIGRPRRQRNKHATEDECLKDCAEWYAIDRKYCEGLPPEERAECLKQAEDTRDQCIDDCLGGGG